MADTEIARVNYYQRQFLTAQDFRDEQTYQRGISRRHNIAHHTWGIVIGMELLEKPREGDAPFVDVWLQPGFAIDGYGRQIVVQQPRKLDPADFDSFANLLHREVWIDFDEEKSRRSGAGFEQCNTENGFSRLRESYRFVIDPPRPVHESIIVAGKEVQFPAVPAQGDLKIPEDESVPFQQLPDGPDRRKWLIRIGSANWDGSAGVKKFRPAAADRLMEGRRYAGAVADHIVAPAKSLTLARREKPSDTDAEDFAVVDGRLQVNGRIVAKKDVYIHGGKLHFHSTAGLDEGAPLWMQRISGANKELRIHIGDDDKEPKNRLTIGPLSGAVEKSVFTVRADDRVEISTGVLAFGAQTRQMINLWNSNYGIGVQNSTLYFRTESDVYWWRGGAHDNDPANAANGQMQMRLDGQGSLHFGERVRQMLNLWSTQYGIGVQAATLYFRTFTDFCWFRGGGHADAQSDPGGGALEMKLDSNNVLTLNGPFIAKGNIELHGSRLDFRMPDGGTDTDLLQITRNNRGFNLNDLRIIIGDDVDGNDRFTVGPVSVADGLYKEQFVVLNNGDVRVGKRLFVDNVQVPVDVKSGVRNLNRLGAGSGTDTFPVTSAFSAASGATIMVALSDIRNRGVANDARWRVTPNAAGPQRIGANSFNFSVDWQVDDSDGDLLAYSYIIIFSP